jgi:nucleotide-binding universal stress UspA family protein
LVSKLLPGTQVEVTLLQVLSSALPQYAVAEASIPEEYTEQQMEDYKQKAIDYLNSTGESLRSRGATVTAKVAEGNASEEIVKAAEEVDTDLISMSTHGRSGISRWAFGSVTDKVLRRETKIPILMIRAQR